MISERPLLPGAHAAGLGADVDDVHVARVDDVTAGASCRVSAACTTRVQSSGPTRLLRIRSHGTRASAHSRRMPISKRDISSENIATDLPVDRDVARHVRGQRGLADARPRGDDDEVAGLQARREVVEVAEAGGQAREGGVAVLDGLEVDHRLVDQVAQDRDLVLVLAAGDVVDPLLGVVGDHARRRSGRRRPSP